VCVFVCEQLAQSATAISDAHNFMIEIQTLTTLTMILCYLNKIVLKRNLSAVSVMNAGHSEVDVSCE